jgi:hypothetical protein
MTKVNFSATRKRAVEAGLLGGGAAWKPKEGDNRIRLVSECLEHPGSYNGKKTFKWLCFILDRADGDVKPYFMPDTVYEQIETLQLNPEFAFEEVPMPYDVTLSVKNAGKKEVVYVVQGARANTPLTPAELEKIAAAGSIRDYQATVYESQGATGENTERTIEISHDDAPPPTEPPPPARYNTIPEAYRPKA